MFGDRLKELRHSQNMTQAELAKILGMSSRTVASYEQGVNEPSIATITKLCKIFNVTSDYLIGLSEVKTADLNVAYISDYLGLTPRSISELHMFQKIKNEGNPRMAQKISTLNLFFYPACDLLEYITDYLHFSATHFKNFTEESLDTLTPISELELWDEVSKTGYSEDCDVWSKSILLTIEAELTYWRKVSLEKRDSDLRNSK